MERFIPLSSQLLYPLQQVAKHDPLQWSDQCEEVFQNVKEVLGAVLAMQVLDWNQVFLCESFCGRRRHWGNATTKMERESIHEANLLCLQSEDNG